MEVRPDKRQVISLRGNARMIKDEEEEALYVDKVPDFNKRFHCS